MDGYCKISTSTRWRSRALNSIYTLLIEASPGAGKPRCDMRFSSLLFFPALLSRTFYFLYFYFGQWLKRFGLCDVSVIIHHLQRRLATFLATYICCHHQEQGTQQRRQGFGSMAKQLAAEEGCPSQKLFEVLSGAFIGHRSTKHFHFRR